MENALSKIAEWTNINADQFHNEVMPLNQPAVLRSVVSNWPMVEMAKKSNEDAITYLKTFDQQTPMYTIVGEPAIAGRFFYSDDLRGVNFQRTQATLSTVLDQLNALAGKKNTHAIAIQAASIREPKFFQFLLIFC